MNEGAAIGLLCGLAAAISSLLYDFAALLLSPLRLCVFAGNFSYRSRKRLSTEMSSSSETQ